MRETDKIGDVTHVWVSLHGLPHKQHH